MWTEQETKRYEEHLEKHWTRDGQYIGNLSTCPKCGELSAQGLWIDNEPPFWCECGYGKTNRVGYKIPFAVL